jgi:hypothetical protein
MVVFYRCSCTRKCYKSKALEGLNAARDLYNSISPANKPGGSDQGSGELGALTLAQVFINQQVVQNYKW